MKTILLTTPLIALFVVMPAAAQAGAQEIPTYEFSASYAFTPSPSSYISGSDPSDGENRQGWEASAVTNFNDVFGLEFSGSGSYGTIGTTGERISTHGLMVGPRFTYRENSRIAPFGRALAGAVHRNVPNFTDAFFATQVGGGITIFTSQHLGFVTGGDYRRSVRGLEWDDFTMYVGFSLR